MQRRTLCTLGADPAVAAYASMGISAAQETGLDDPGSAASDQRRGGRRLGELA